MEKTFAPLAKIKPGRVFGLELPVGRVAEGYAAMDARAAIKVILKV